MSNQIAQVVLKILCQSLRDKKDNGDIDNAMSSTKTQRHAPLQKCGRINGLIKWQNCWKACTASPAWVKGSQGQNPADISLPLSPSIHSGPMGFHIIRKGCAGILIAVVVLLDRLVYCWMGLVYYL